MDPTCQAPHQILHILKYTSLSVENELSTADGVELGVDCGVERRTEVLTAAPELREVEPGGVPAKAEHVAIIGERGLLGGWWRPSSRVRDNVRGEERAPRRD